MPTRYRIHEPHRAYFVTVTVIEWLPIFTTGGCCDIIVHSLEHCRLKKGLKIHAWVIMDNHLHAILAAPDLAAVLRDFKSFTARQLLAQIAEEKREWLLNQLRFYRAPNRAAEFQVWQDGAHPQAILSDAFMEQKLEYLHNNPVKRGWVSSPEHWRYTSAHEWCPGAVAMLKCDPWR
jgi:putative transposase